MIVIFGQSRITGKILFRLNHIRKTHTFMKRQLCLINLNALWGKLVYHPMQGASLFPWLVLWASIQFDFTFAEWNNRQTGFANVRSGNIVRNNNHRWNYKIENPHTDVAYCCINSRIMCHSFWNQRKIFLIRLHWSTFVYTRLNSRLATCLHSSTFVCDSSAFVYTRLNSSTRLCF